MISVNRRDAMKLAAGSLVAAKSALVNDVARADESKKKEETKQTKVTAVSAAAFVKALEIAQPIPLGADVLKAHVSLTASTASGFVDDGELVSVTKNLNDQQQSDVLNSLLLAQLAANKKYDRENQTEDWYKFYRTVLENVGWVINAFTFAKYSGTGGSFAVDKTVIEILAAICTGDELAVAQSTLAALKKLSDDDGRIVLFERESHSLHNGNFQVATANVSNNVVVLKIGAFSFSSSQDVTKVLFFTFSSASANFYQGSQKIELNQDVYNQVRDDIIAKLGDKAKTFVKNLDI